MPTAIISDLNMADDTNEKFYILYNVAVTFTDAFREKWKLSITVRAEGQIDCYGPEGNRKETMFQYQFGGFSQQPDSIGLKKVA